MSMGYVKCPYCNNTGAEALYAVDEKKECFCINCLAEWTEEQEVEVTTSQQQWMMAHYGEE
jgi:uncharacterized Zn ribbon protein